MSTPRRNTLPATLRIRARQDFDRIFRSGVRASDARMTLLGAPKPSSPARLGISVPRRYGNAVKRNRIKRLIREAFRTVRHDLPQAADWMVIPRSGPEPTVDQLRDSLLRLAGKLVRRLEPAESTEPADPRACDGRSASGQGDTPLPSRPAPEPL